MKRRIGVDIGMKGDYKVVVVDESGYTGRPMSIEVSYEGFCKIRDLAFNGSDRCTSQVAMEPTGNAWLPLAAFLRTSGVPVVLVNTRKVSDFRKVLRRYAKTDVVDAEAIAKLTLIDPQRSPVHEMPSADVLSLRRLLKQRHRIVRGATANKLRIHAATQLTNPGLMECFGEEKFSTAARVMFRDFVDPFSVEKLGEKRFGKQLRQKGGHASDELVHTVFSQCEKTCTLYRRLIEEKTLPFDYEFLAQEIRSELVEIEHAEARVTEIDRSIKELYDRVDPTQALRQIPGMGDTIAPAIEAFSSPADRFRNAKAYASYCGLVPRMSQTGVSPHDASHHITKTGNRILKNYFYLAAETARRIDPELAAFYAARNAAGWHHGRIMTAIAHKLVRRTYAMLQRREDDALRPKTERQEPAYSLRTPDGKVVDRKTARAYVAEHYPSKRERAHRRLQEREKNKRDASQLANEGQPKGSTKRVKQDHVPPIKVPQGSPSVQQINS